MKGLTLCTVAIALTSLSLPLVAADMPKELFNKELLAGNVLINGIKWPDDQHKIGFKTIVIGDPFNFKDPRVSYVKPGYGPTRPEAPFDCTPLSFAPIAKCTLILWNDAKDFPQELQDLESAFGGHVKLSFSVVFSRVMSPMEFANGDLSDGRISSIELTNNEPSRDFVSKATAYFTDKYGSQPIVRRTYQNPDGLYSKECIAELRGINNKPLSELTLNDQSVLKRCDGLAKLAILSGKGTSGSKSQYLWSVYNGQYNIAITSDETSVGDQSSGFLTLSRSAVISIDLNDKDTGIQAWGAAVNKTKADWSADQQNKDKKDF